MLGLLLALSIGPHLVGPETLEWLVTASLATVAPIWIAIPWMIRISREELEWEIFLAERRSPPTPARERGFDCGLTVV